MYKILSVLFLFVHLFSSAPAFSQRPVQSPSQPKIMLDDGTLVGHGNPMPVDAEVSIGSITVDVFPVYADENGNPATATVDINNRAIVSVGSESIGLIDAVKAVVSEWSQQTLALPANTSTTITSGVTGERVFIEVKSHLPNQTFWISASNSAVIGDCRPCTEYFYAEIPAGIDVSVIASTAMDLSIVEGGR